MTDLKHTRRQKQPMAPAPDRLPPHSQEAEAGALGCCLLDWRKVAVLEGAFGAAGSKAFYDLRHQAMFQVMQDLIATGHEIEPVAVADRLKATGLLDQCGGLAYVLALTNATPSPEQAPGFSALVAEKHALRQLLQLCYSTAARVYDYNGEVPALLDEFERDALAVGSSRVQSRDADIPAIQQGWCEKYDETFKNHKPVGLMSGYDNLDAIAGGMKRKEFIVLGGRPSSFKTTFALCLMAKQAAAGTTVSFLSGETGAESLIHRLQCMEARVDGEAFMQGRATERDMQHMVTGMAKVASYRSRLLIDDGPLGMDLIAKARRHHQKGARLFIVDMLQLIAAQGSNEFERVTNASLLGKRMAQELDCPVIFISALKRPEKGSSVKPKLTDLRQSGQIESDADKVYLLHVDEDDKDAPIKTVQGDVAKHKNGRTGPFSLTVFAAEFRMEPGAWPGTEERQPPRERETEDYAPDAR